MSGGVGGHGPLGKLRHYEVASEASSTSKFLMMVMTNIKMLIYSQH